MTKGVGKAMRIKKRISKILYEDQLRILEGLKVKKYLQRLRIVGTVISGLIKSNN